MVDKRKQEVLGVREVAVTPCSQTRGPGGAGAAVAPCRDKLCWLQVMVEARLAALRKRGVVLPPPILVADSWFADSKLMRHVAATHQGTLLVAGKHSPWLQYQVERIIGVVEALETLPDLRQLV